MNISKNIMRHFFTFIFAALITNLAIAVSTETTNVPNQSTQQVVKPQSQQLPIKDVQRFTTAITEIKNYYVNSVTDHELFENAIRGMLQNLDPHSAYLDQHELKELMSMTKGEFGGLGLEVTMEDGIVKVISPIDDTPAQKAGIKAGDYIVIIDDVPIKGMQLKDIVEKMRGKKGTPVNITIVRKGETKPMQFNLIREVIVVKSVKSKMLEPGYGYIRISQFQGPSAKEVLQTIESLKKQAGGKLKGLVLDLRDNPGGLLDSAVEISNYFLDSSKLKNKLIVFTKSRIPNAEYKAHASGNDILGGVPIVVLINQGSASGAEILAGALQDHKRAILVGTPTFGKGSVQTILPLDDSTAIKLTTALYYTPSGRSIQATGITPDIYVEDMKITKNTNANKNVLEVKEQNLTGHLANGNGVVASNAIDKSSKDDLIYTDFPLHQALFILQAHAYRDK